MQSGRMALGLLAAAFLTWPADAGAQVRLGPVAGFSLLERKDTSLSHGPLEDEVTLGRTWLVGGVVDAAFTVHDHLTFEFLYGPYHNDIDRFCISRSVGSSITCEPQVGMEAAHALLFGMQYARTFGASAWRPYVTGGIGAKRYSFRDDFTTPKTSPTFSFGAGAETGTRRLVRLELRAILVQHNQLIRDERQTELQARVVMLLF